MILPFLCLCMQPGHVALSQDIVIAAPTVALCMRQGVVVSLTNRLTGENYATPRAEAGSLPALRSLGRTLAARDSTASATPKSRDVTLHGGASSTLQWAGKSRLTTRLNLEKKGGISLQQSAATSEPGLYGVAWSIAFVPEKFEVLVPGNSGQRFGADAPYETREFDYPMGWEAPFVIIQGARGGVLIQAEDPAMTPKMLTVDRLVGGFRISLESRNQAPWSSVRSLTGCRWIVRGYAGPWQVGVAMYRSWAAKTYGLRAVAAKRPAWAAGIRSVAIVGMDLQTIRLLAHHVVPQRTLLYVPGWRRDGYDRNYPDYTAAPEFGPFVAEAHRLGFRVMPHVNYFGCDPKNPEYERFRRYQMKDPMTGQLLWWDWKLADPPIRFAYINPASREWRKLFVERMKTFCRQYDIDALHLDQTLCIFNDANGRIDGMTCAEGNLALHKELKEALPDVALSGEGLNEITCRYEEFAQRHVWGVDHTTGRWNERSIAMAHPVSSAVLLPYTSMYGYLGMPNPDHAPDLYRAWMRAYERFGVIPTYAWPSQEQLRAPSPAVRGLLRRIGLAMRYALSPDFSATWQPGEIFVWRVGDGGRLRYVADQGVALQLRLPGEQRYSTLQRRLEGVERYAGPGSVPGWPAYDRNTIQGLDPSQRYEWTPEPRDLTALHVEAIPSGWHVARAGRHGDLFRIELASHRAGMRTLRLWEEAKTAHAGVVGPSGRAVKVPGVSCSDDASGGAVRPDGDGLFMHPPWKGLPADRAGRTGLRTFVEYRLRLPQVAELRLEAGAEIRPGAGETDGVRFTAAVWPEDEPDQRLVTNVLAVPGETRPIRLNLSRFQGKRIVLLLEADAGPAGDPTFDWGRLDQPRIVVEEVPGAGPRGEIMISGTKPVGRVLLAGGEAIVGRRPDGISITLPLPNVVTIPFTDPVIVPGTPDAQGVLLKLANLPLAARTRSESGMEGRAPQFAPGVGPAVCGGVERPAIHAHPPGQGCTLLDYHLKLPETPCRLVTAMGIRDGSKSTGVGFRVEVNGRQLFAKDTRPGTGWTPVVVDLSAYAGKEILLTLVTDALGAYDFDWAAWADPHLATL